MTTEIRNHDHSAFFPALTEKWVQLIDDNRDRSIIMVAGQAGQGKTTSILHYLVDKAIPYIHMRLAPEGSPDGSLSNRIAGLLNSASTPDKSGRPPNKPSDKPCRAQANEIALQYLTRLPRGLTLFLDDIHLLSENSRDLDFINEMIRQSPPDIHFICAGRGLQTGLFREQREKFCLIDADRTHIPFDVFLGWADSWQLSLSTDHIGRIFSLCDDWIAGGVLIAQHLRTIDVSCRERFIQSMEEGKLPPLLTRFFDSEVLSSFSLQMQRQLILLAIPDIIDTQAPLPSAFYLGKLTVDLVESKHLFQKEVRSQLTGHGLRFNRLFRHYLLGRYREQYDENKRKEICAQCGDYFVEAGKALLSVGCYVQATDLLRTRAILSRHGEDTIRYCESINLGYWLSFFDEQEILSDPWMTVFHCAAHRFSEMEDKTRRLENALTGFKSQKSLTGSMLATALLIENLILSGDPSGAMPRLQDDASSLLQQAAACRLSYGNALLRIQMGSYHIFFSGKLQSARDHLWKAYSIGRQIKDHNLQVYALTLLCVSSGLARDRADGNEFKILLAGQFNYEISERMALLGKLGIVALDISRPTDAQVTEWLNKVKKQTELASLALLRPFVLFVEAMLHFYSRNYGAAASICRHLIQFANSTSHPFFKSLCYRLLAQLAYLEGNLTEAESFLNNCVEPDIDRSIGIHQARVLQLKAALDLHGGKPERAGRILSWLQQEFETHLNYVSTVENYFLRGIHAHAQCDQVACLQYLESGFIIAAREEIDVFLILAPEDIVQACILAIEYGKGICFEYAQSLLTGPFSQAACGYFGVLCSKNCTTLQERLVQIQKIAVLKNRPVITIRTLGDFMVLRDGSPIDALQWSGLYPQLLLKAIISRGCKNILLDQLIEDLWPDHEPQKAMQTFRVTLHRLRKTLEPDISKNFGSSYIFFKDGVVFLNDQLVHVDTVQFRLLTEQAQKAANSGVTNSALEICRIADALYRGDFLPCELYNQWAEAERERLRILHIEHLLLLTRLFEAGGNLMDSGAVLSKLLELDPYNEVFYRKLILTYIRLGMRAKAMATYNTCRMILKSELDTEPDPETLAVYEKYIIAPGGNSQDFDAVLPRRPKA